MLDSVAVHLEVLLSGGVGVEGWVVGLPVDIGVVRREWEWGGVEGVDVGTHAVLGAFGHNSLDFDLFWVGFLSLFLMLLVVGLGVVAFHLFVLGKRVIINFIL